MQSEWLLNTIYLNEAEKEKIPLLKSVICYKIIALIGIIFYFKRNEFLKGENLAVSHLGISMKIRVKRMDPRKDAAAQMTEANATYKWTHWAFFLLS